MTMIDRSHPNLVEPEGPLIDFVRWLDHWGFQEVKLIPGGRFAAVLNYGFNWRLVTGRLLGRDTILDGWCYPTLDRAKIALEAWDGTGEPGGWLKHPPTNRCRPGCDPARESIGWPIGADPYEGVR